MPKYGRGLNREIVEAVNRGEMSEPFGIRDVKEFARRRGWNVPDSYSNVALANAASPEHSQMYKKYFYQVGEGRYRLREEFRGSI